jgi:hypothetical protein
LLIIAIQFLLSSGCNKEGTRPCINSGYIFSINSEWSPQNEVYNVGDTLYLISSFPKLLTNQVTSNIIDYSDATEIGGSYVFYELDTTLRQVKGAIQKFDFFPSKGTIQNGIIVPNEQKLVAYAELANNYSFNCKIVTKAKGIYAFFISNLSCNGLRGKNCTNAGFTNTLTNTNKHISLFEYAIGRPPASQYEVDRIYCFRVQ